MIPDSIQACQFSEQASPVVVYYGGVSILMSAYEIVRLEETLAGDPFSPLPRSSYRRLTYPRPHPAFRGELLSFIHEIRAEVQQIPLRQSFATAQDRLSRQVTRPVVITLRLEDGREYVGESVPVAYVTGETPESVQTAVEQIRPLLIGMDILRFQPLLQTLSTALLHAPAARAGLEMALYAARADAFHTSLWSLFGGAIEEVETDITLPLVEDTEERARRAAREGFRRFKLKVGSPDHRADLARLRAVHQAVPEATFQVDVNQAFTAETALDFIRRALDAGVRLELVEQPVAKEDITALDAVAAASPVPIFADEAIQSPADALRLIRETRVQGINVKLMKAGVCGALDILAIARAAGRKLMIGCMLETRRGIGFSLALACGTGAFDYVDLDSHRFVHEEGENPYFTEKGPFLSVARGIE